MWFQWVLLNFRTPVDSTIGENSGMTVVGRFLQMKVKKQSGKQGGLMLSDKMFHFSWLRRPTCALSSSLICSQTYLIFRLITELLDGSHLWFGVCVVQMGGTLLYRVFLLWINWKYMARHHLCLQSDWFYITSPPGCKHIIGRNKLHLTTNGDKFPVLCAEAD